MQNAYSPMSTEKIAQFVKANFPKLSMKQQIELTQYVIEEGGLSYVSKQDMQAYVSKYMKKGNAMTNNLEAKKLAVIKSNAAPEVKLKALEKLNAMLTNARTFNVTISKLTEKNGKLYADVEIPGYFKTSQTFLGMVGLGHSQDSLIQHYVSQFERDLKAEAKITVKK